MLTYKVDVKADFVNGAIGKLVAITASCVSVKFDRLLIYICKFSGGFFKVYET